jgi:hypothetical protein
VETGRAVVQQVLHGIVDDGLFDLVRVVQGQSANPPAQIFCGADPPQHIQFFTDHPVK